MGRLRASPSVSPCPTGWMRCTKCRTRSCSPATRQTDRRPRPVCSLRLRPYFVRRRRSSRITTEVAMLLTLAPVAQLDRAPASGAGCGGSSPSGRTSTIPSFSRCPGGFSRRDPLLSASVRILEVLELERSAVFSQRDRRGFHLRPRRSIEEGVERELLVQQAVFEKATNGL